MNLLQLPHLIHLLEGLHNMNAADALSIAKQHPHTVTEILAGLAAAAQKDPSFIPDLIGAVETKNYAGFALKHISLLLGLGGIIAGNQGLVDQIGALTSQP